MTVFAPPAVNNGVQLLMPVSDGSVRYVMMTDGSGQLSLAQQSYNDLSSTPSLGSAAAKNISFFLNTGNALSELSGVSASALANIGAAPLTSPTFLGTPAAPTATLSDSSTQLATTAFVKGQAYAALAGPTFTGTPLAPTAAASTNTTQIATTAFVTTAVSNAAITKAGENYLTLSGGVLTANAVTLSGTNVTGILTLAKGGTGADLSATGGANKVVMQTSSGGVLTVAQLAASNLSDGTTGTGNIVLASGGTLTNPIVGTQTSSDNSTKAASTAYVTTAINTVLAAAPNKASVKYATTSALPANTYANGSSGVGATITANSNGTWTVDGSALILNDTVLVHNESTTANNGIYTVTQAGDASHTTILTRRTDFDQTAEIFAGDSTFVTSGSTMASTTWAMITAGSITVGSTAITWTQTAGPGSYVAGTGLTLTGTTFSITNTISASSVGSSTAIPVLTYNAQGQLTGTSTAAVVAPAGTLIGATLAAGVTASSLTSVGTIATGVWQGTKVGLAYGGTNADLSATGGTSQVLKQTSVGGAVTVGQLAIGDLSTVSSYTYLGNSTASTAASTANTVLTLGTPSGTFSAAAGSVLGQFSSNTNQYSQLCVQNLNSGSSASSDFVATADTGTDSTKYLDIGINNSTGAATPFSTALACYMYTDQAELDIGALGTSGVVNIYASGGTTTPTKAVAFSGTASTFSGQIVTSLAGAASAPSVNITGAPYTSGTATTNYPLVYLNSGASGPTTLSTAGTALGFNMVSGFTGNMAAGHVNGGAQLWKIDYQGQFYATNFRVTGSTGIVQCGNLNNGDSSQTIINCTTGTTALLFSGATNPFVTFGASTSSGVGLRRSGTTLACVLGDNSADAAFTCGAFTSTVSNITTTSTDGIVLQNNTASTSGVPVQYSPRLRMIGHVWNTATPADNQIEYFMEVEPTSGSTTGANLYIKSVNAGTTTTALQLNSAGVITGTGGLTSGGSVLISGTSNQFSVNNDTFLKRGGSAATWQLGTSDAASPVAQSLQVQSVVAGTSNTAGSDWTLIGSKSTGTGTPGNQVLSNSFAGVSTTVTVTVTIASPAVFSLASHGFVPGSSFTLTTTGALPTGLATATTYYVISTNLASGTFQASATPGGSAITTSGSQSGTHTLTSTSTVQNPASTIATWGPSGITGSQTTSLLNLAQTWNTSGSPTAIKLNVTNIASNSASLLLDLQSSGTSIFNVGASSAVFNRQAYFAQTTLTDSTTISWDVSVNQSAMVTLGGNRTLSPSNMKAGASYTLIVKQDGTGSRTLAYSNCKWPGGTVPVLSTTAASVDILTFISDGTSLFGVCQKAFA